MEKQGQSIQFGVIHDHEYVKYYVCMYELVNVISMCIFICMYVWVWNICNFQKISCQ